MTSAGKKFRQALEAEKPLQVVGTINAYTAIMAEAVGFKAIYLSGAGVANASYGLPDLGITSLNDVVEDVSRITGACSLPLLVDVDTGFGGAFNIARTVKKMINAGAAGVHIEDQVAQKRCGHRPNKEIVSREEMEDRIKAAVDAKTDGNFIVMARTDPQIAGSRGVSAFIVEADAPGLSIGPIDKKMGQSGAHTAELLFNDCRVPVSALVGGKEGNGFKTAMGGINHARLHVAATCVGQAIRLTEEALTYAQQRVQFDQPIVNFQAIQHMLA
ncbi:MAG: isocitrate lyase/phosphoenolpyruvate mutase family protein, partial [Proteobacteria bacterium]|nr:isocitrate lyase/phosphoenolpyruvate mutase family protein [Pseudomonadota bacterium]